MAYGAHNTNRSQEQFVCAKPDATSLLSLTPSCAVTRRYTSIIQTCEKARCG